MYIVLEVQTMNDGTIGTIIDSFADRNEAENKYHTILAYAAISNLPIHTVFLLKNDGYTVKSEGYTHDIEEE